MKENNNMAEITLEQIQAALKATNTKVERTSNFMKYFGIVMLSTIPAMIINAHITKEQKKASRIADMIAINELNDYRKFKQTIYLTHKVILFRLKSDAY